MAVHMSESRFHGVHVRENTDLVTAINDIESSVIGVVAVADDADANTFPLNTPVLLTRVNNVLGKAGKTGSLYKTLKAIADQASPKVIVVRVEAAGKDGGKTQNHGWPPAPTDATRQQRDHRYQRLGESQSGLDPDAVIGWRHRFGADRDDRRVIPGAGATGRPARQAATGLQSADRRAWTRWRALFSSLGGVSGGAMARVSGWRGIFSTLTAGAGRLMALIAPLKSLLLGVFQSPSAALGTLGRGIGGLALRLARLPALWSLITAALSGLGAALSFLLSPIALIGAAFVAAGVLIWKYWAPIKAFFAGVLDGIMAKLAPLREAFTQFSPLFDAIGAGIGRVFDGFKALLSPMESSRDTLDKCAGAGDRLDTGKARPHPCRPGGCTPQSGEPAESARDVGVGSATKKDGAQEAARLKAESLQKAPVMWEWDPQQKKMVRKGWNWSPKAAPFVGPPAPPGVAPPPSPLGGERGTQRRLQKIADNTGGLLEETKKRIGPGDIIFKNLPRALAVRGEWQGERLASTPHTRALSPRPAVMAASLPVTQAELPPVRRSLHPMAVASSGFSGEIHVHLHGVDRQDARDIGRIAADAVNAELARREQFSRSSFKDRD
uniref:Tail sheath protein Gp18-like domain-containing protein n=1 Tax=Glossina brevipalpis TaxID=37001 RepID=A0A1A9WZ33_9MUSC